MTTIHWSMLQVGDYVWDGNEYRRIARKNGVMRMGSRLFPEYTDDKGDIFYLTTTHVRAYA